MKPAIFSAGLFQFMWTWNQVLAMALVTVVPLNCTFGSEF